MYLFKLGVVSPESSQAIYHVLARRGIESVIILSPAERYVCVGYFQDPRQCVDLDFCRQERIPILRREVGGGVVLLDSNQVFYQVVLRSDNPLLPTTVAGTYERFSIAPIATYRRLGVPCKHRPVNDIVTLDGRKVSGQGGADIGVSQVFVGNIILDFDYETMARALRVSDEKFRDKIHKTMRENLTTLKRELGRAPSRETVEGILVEEFEKILGPLEEKPLPADVIPEIEEMGRYLSSKEFLFKEGPRGGRAPRAVTIRDGVMVGRADYKAPGGLITAEVEVAEGVITWLHLSGDFTFRPKGEFEGLISAIRGLPLEGQAIESAVRAFCSSRSVEIPGVEPGDIAGVIVKAAG